MNMTNARTSMLLLHVRMLNMILLAVIKSIHLIGITTEIKFKHNSSNEKNEKELENLKEKNNNNSEK